MKVQLRRLERSQIKSSDGEFLYELTHSYELSPKLSEQIVLSAKEHLFRDRPLREGQIEVTVVGVEERSGKLLEQMEKKKVRLTLNAGLEDHEAMREVGRRGLRQLRIQRMTEEALDQGGVLSQEDLSRYLSCTVRTIQRDIQEIKQRGIDVRTRGVLHNIGRGQTHKVKIVGLYLDGKTYSEIQLTTRHSVGAIKRYLESFTKVVMAEHRGIVWAKEISAVTGLSENVVRQYQELIQESKRDPIRRENLRQLIRRSGYAEVVKKTFKNNGKTVVRTTGGSL